MIEATTAVLAHCQFDDRSAECVRSFGEPYRVLVNHFGDNLGVTGSLNWLYRNTSAKIIAFFHSDLEIHETWRERVEREFEDQQVVLVGFGGARQLASEDIYRTPYELHQLRRIGYRSNTTDAETHGERFTGSCDVATLDGFALIVRRKFLDEIGGFDERFPFHSYDNALCVKAAQRGYKVRLVGVSCTHYGGRTSTTAEAQAYWKSLGTSDQEIHTESHKLLYALGRGVLPIRC